MSYLKKLGISFLFMISTFLIMTMFMTLFSYFNLLKETGLSIVKIIIPILSLFIGGISFGKRAIQKGWLEGLKLGIIISIFLIIFNYLAFSHSFEIKSLLYYSILIFSSIFGSMIGINYNKKKDS